MVAKPGQAEAVQELLLTNPRRIEQGEQGNLAFGVHRSTDNPNEFWLYETWVDEAAVQAHESGDAFKQYKETLRPLVEPESVIFGNTVPIKVLGYGPLPTAVGRPSPMRLRACRSHSLTVVSPMVGPIVRRASGA
jgi:quinol monooxygenase YgiN